MAQRPRSAAPARPLQSRSAKPNRGNRIESGGSSIPNAREGGVRPAPGESRLQDPSETPWNDLASAKDFGETPPDGDDTPTDEIEERQVAQSAAEKQDKIRTMLGRQFSGGAEPGEGTPAVEAVTEEAPATEEEQATEVPAAEEPPSRRTLMASVDAEQKRLGLERELGNERKARKQAEEALKGGLGEIARRQGLTKDQALELILSDPNADAAPTKPATTTDPGVNDRLTRLEQRERDVNKREALGVVDEVTKELSIPVTRATARVTVTDEKGRTEVMSGRELVLRTAQRLHELDGSPSGVDRRTYITKAAAKVEAQLIDDQKDAFEAYAQSKGAAPAAAAPPAKPRAAPPSLGRRAAGPGATPAGAGGAKLPEDPDERRTAIKARFGLR